MNIFIERTFREEDKNRIKVNIKKAIEFLGLSRLKSPEESIEKIVRKRIAGMSYAWSL